MTQTPEENRTARSDLVPISPARLAGLWVVLVLAALVLHLGFAWLIGRLGLRLGAIRPELAPLYAYWNPHLKGWLAVPIVWAVVYWRFLGRTRCLATLSEAATRLVLLLAFLTTTLTVALIDGGPRSWIAPFDSRADLEYYGAINRVGNVWAFLAGYVQLAPTLPMHAQTHPPGAILLLAAWTYAFGGGPWAAALGAVAVASLAVLAVHELAKRVVDPCSARTAAVLFTVTPNAVLFSTTSMDGPFMTVLVAAYTWFWIGLTSQRLRHGVAAGLLAYLGSMLTYSTVIVVLFCALAWVWFLAARPELRTRALRVGLASAVVFVLAHAATWLATGFNPVAMLRLAIAHDHQIMSGTRHETWLQYAALGVGNLSAFLIGTGLATVALWFHASSRAVRAARRTAERSSNLVPFVLCGGASVLIAAFLPVYSLEVERIWIFLAPLLIVPAAAALGPPETEAGRQSTRMAVALLLLQCLITESCLNTYW